MAQGQESEEEGEMMAKNKKTATKGINVESKILHCENCGRTTKHNFLRQEFRKFQYHSSKEGCEKNGDGIKDIWECDVCMEERIYGACEDRKIALWTIRDEKAAIAKMVKNFSSSRVHLLFINPEEWVNQYIKGLDRRVLGFDGGILTRKERLELKEYALKQVKNYYKRQKRAVA